MSNLDVARDDSEDHLHDEMVHGHEHIHITHYVRPHEEAAHLTASHSHEHNHPALRHTHTSHEDPDKEHEREAHIHDHERPERSPA
jgi:hypothetical protein